MLFKSDFGLRSGSAEAGDLGLEMEAAIAEPSSGAAGTGFAFIARLNNDATNFYAKGNVSNPKSTIATFTATNLTTLFDAALQVRLLGDVHIGGALYLTANSTVSSGLQLYNYRFIYRGAGGDTLTLPDPADPDNSAARTQGQSNREHDVLNVGTGPLTFSRQVWLGPTTFITELSAVSPDNHLTLVFDAVSGKIWGIR